VAEVKFQLSISHLLTLDFLPGFYPSSYHQPFNGNQMYPPEFGFPPNAQCYPIQQPTEYYFEQSYSPGK